jgi:hypothetical protein
MSRNIPGGTITLKQENTNSNIYSSEKDKRKTILRYYDLFSYLQLIFRSVYHQSQFVDTIFKAIPCVLNDILMYNNIAFKRIDLTLFEESTNIIEPLWFEFDVATARLVLYGDMFFLEKFMNNKEYKRITFINEQLPFVLFNDDSETHIIEKKLQSLIVWYCAIISLNMSLIRIILIKRK